MIGLGPLVSTHTTSNTNKWLGLLFGILFVSAAPVLCMATTYLAYTAYANYGINRALRVEPYIPAIIGVALFIFGLIGIVGAWRTWKQAVGLFENGFAFADRAGIVQYRWEDIKTVNFSITKIYRYGIHTGTTYHYTLSPHNAKAVILDNRFSNIAALGDAILKGTTVANFPRYWQALQSGERLSFGPLAIDRQGMYSGRKAIAWNEVMAVRISQGIISIKKAGGWLNWAGVSVSQVPNFYIFYELVGRFAKME